MFGLKKFKNSASTLYFLKLYNKCFCSKKFFWRKKWTHVSKISNQLKIFFEKKSWLKQRLSRKLYDTVFLQTPNVKNVYWVFFCLNGRQTKQKIQEDKLKFLKMVNLFKGCSILKNMEPKLRTEWFILIQANEVNFKRRVRTWQFILTLKCHIDKG